MQQIKDVTEETRALEIELQRLKERARATIMPYFIKTIEITLDEFLQDFIARRALMLNCIDLGEAESAERFARVTAKDAIFYMGYKGNPYREDGEK